jgi:hypothetical protein
MRLCDDYFPRLNRFSSRLDATVGPHSKIYARLIQFNATKRTDDASGIGVGVANNDSKPIHFGKPEGKSFDDERSNPLVVVDRRKKDVVKVVVGVDAERLQYPKKLRKRRVGVADEKRLRHRRSGTL